MLKYDDAETYFLNFTRGLPNAAGGIPIGLYLCWAADAGLVPEALKREIDTRRERGQSPADLLFDLTDGKLTSGEFTEEGQAFTGDYYDSDYLADYRRCFNLADDAADTLCSVADAAVSLQRIKPYLNERLIRWRTTSRQATVTPMKADELFAWLQARLLPELRADGFEDLEPRRNEFEVHRRHGQIEQVLLFMVYDANGSTQATFGCYLGATRLRQAGMALLDAPTKNFNASVRIAPDIKVDEFNLVPGLSGLVPYTHRIPAGRSQEGEIRLAHYLEWVRPILNGLDSIAKLAQFSRKQGLRHQGGFAPELAARTLLLSVYGDHLRGEDRAEYLEQLRSRVSRRNSAYADELLTREQLDTLIERVQQPGVIERLRAEFDATEG